MTNPTILYSQHNPWCPSLRVDQPNDGIPPDNRKACLGCPTATLTLTGTEPVEVVREWVERLQEAGYGCADCDAVFSMQDGPHCCGTGDLPIQKITTRLLRFTGQGDLAKVLSAADIDTSGIDGVALPKRCAEDRCDGRGHIISQGYWTDNCRYCAHIAALLAEIGGDDE